MNTRRTTNILLLLIVLFLGALLLARLPVKELCADTLRLDTCITSSPVDLPDSYVHVVVHNASPLGAKN